MDLKQMLSEMITSKLTEQCKRGDIVEVPGHGSTKHKAVMLSSDKAVYLEDDGSVEPVPSNLIQKCVKVKKSSATEKKLATEYLKNMNEAAKIGCLKCDEVSTAAAWKKNSGFCPKCKVSSQGVAESVDLTESTINKANIEKAVQVLLDYKKGVSVIKISDTDFEGTIDPKETGPLSAIYKTITFKGRIESAPNGSDNYILWDLSFSWQHNDGGRNGYTINDMMIGIFTGKISARMPKDKMIAHAKKFGW